MKTVALRYIKSFVKWFFLALITGLVSGAVGALFHRLIELATKTREEHDALIWFLPLVGVLIAAVYGLVKKPLSTNSVISGIREKKAVSPLIVPVIFIGTVLTHLVGGSAGREGAALQIGGGLGSGIGKLFKTDEETAGILTVVGMAGAFSAIFTTPVTAAIFAMEVVAVGHMRYFQLMPCMVSSVTAYFVTRLFGNEVLSFNSVIMPEMTVGAVLKIALIAVITAVMSIAFCVILHKTEKLMTEKIKNSYLRAFFGGAVVLILTLALNTRMYNGAGMDTVAFMLSGEKEKITAAMTGITALAFLIKTVMTALSIGSGFKGGEIVPAFFTGTTLGAVLGILLGVDPSFAAAIGMVGMFAGITNCPIASIILSCELFGADSIVYFALAVGVAFILSGRFSLYNSQRIVYEKYGVEKIK